ncbi:acyl-CoA/acyl-ACP dehydrogenase [Pelagibacterales bacterium]|jgi:alkylation response protein AidB-like acyl-CoA dehydrogenase|nr:acyl-CoA/acyl-ACP dehydrogenase [Pelagibacterales bacterium]|tara:strand:- start:580 stop:1710 length:1131 start_codon:yes stop_codon:yes gene_type:complete
MNFDFSDDQKLLQEQARKFLTDKCSRKLVRSVLDNNKNQYSKELWQEVVNMGWTATAIPEEYGGLGLGMLELCVIAEELGRSLAPIPFSSSIYIFAEFLKAYGSEDQKKQYLPKIASGELIGSFAFPETKGTPRTNNINSKVENDKLSGKKLPVNDGQVADVLIVAANSDNNQNHNSLSLYIVETNQAGVEEKLLDTLDPTRPSSQIEFSNVACSVLGEKGEGWSMIQNILNRAAVLFAFEQVGGAQVALDEAKKYSIERYAFGKPIGSFQALKHKMADMYVKNELAKSNAYYGAWALSTDSMELPVAAAGARVSATEAFHYASKENIQIHGGVGFTWEYDCHLFYRRSKLLSLNLGSIRKWKENLISNLEKRNIT